MKFHKIQYLAFNIIFQLYSRVVPYLAKFIGIIPIRLTLILTNKCNLKCANCFEKDQLNKPVSNEMTSAEWLRVIESTSRLTIVDILGGEVFLYKELDKILDKCKERKILVSLTTNASFMNEQNIKKIFENEIYYLMISIDGLGQTHDEYRGRKNHFDQIISVLNEISVIKKKHRRLKPFICLNYLIMNSNIHQLVDFIEYFEKIDGVDEIKFSFVTQKKYWYELKASTDLDVVFKESKDNYLFSEESIKYFKGMLPKLKSKVKNSRLRIGFKPDLAELEDYVDFLKNKDNFFAGECFLPRSNFTILNNGDLIPCLSYGLGNIRDYKYQVNQVLFNEKHQKFLEKQKIEKRNDACRGCVTKSHQRLS